MKLYEELAHSVQAHHNCTGIHHSEWAIKHEDRVTYLASLLPRGSGFDTGTHVNLDKSTGEKLVLETSYHHMNENGMYTHWSNHTITVTPAFNDDFCLKITLGGESKADVIYYYDVFSDSLLQKVP